MLFQSSNAFQCGSITAMTVCRCALRILQVVQLMVTTTFDEKFAENAYVEFPLNLILKTMNENVRDYEQENKLASE